MGDKMLRTICITACLMLGMIQLQAQNGAYNTGVYRNLFKEFLKGMSANLINLKGSEGISATFFSLFQ